MALSITFANLNLRSPSIHAKFGGMYRSFFDALTSIGCKVSYSEGEVLNQDDVLVVPMGGGQEYNSLKIIRNFTGAVVLYVPPAGSWFDSQLLARLHNKILFAYGPDASTYTCQKYAGINIPYCYLPFASDPAVMRPLNIPRQYDVVFVGSLEHAHRRAQFVQYLFQAIDPRSILCVGTGWKEYGIPDQMIAWGPLLNVIYNLGRVCVNIHTDEQVRGMGVHADLNNRIFDLAMAGCCQVSDNSEAVRLCFGPNEVACAEEPEEWIRFIRSLLDNPDAAECYRQNALRRALRDHNWNKRATCFLEWINFYGQNRVSSSMKIDSLFMFSYHRIFRKVKSFTRDLKH